jgi:hypothetical protein
MSYGGSWVNFVGLAHAPPYEQYIRAVDWATQTLTTVGFGDVPAQTNSEKIFAIIWVIHLQYHFFFICQKKPLLSHAIDGSRWSFL